MFYTSTIHYNSMVSIGTDWGLDGPGFKCW